MSQESQLLRASCVPGVSALGKWRLDSRTAGTSGVLLLGKLRQLPGLCSEPQDDKTTQGKAVAKDDSEKGNQGQFRRARQHLKTEE